MDAMERQKKVEAGRAKLAAFRQRKAKADVSESSKAKKKKGEKPSLDLCRLKAQEHSLVHGKQDDVRCIREPKTVVLSPDEGCVGVSSGQTEQIASQVNSSMKVKPSEEICPLPQPTADLVNCSFVQFQDAIRQRDIVIMQLSRSLRDATNSRNFVQQEVTQLTNQVLALHEQLQQSRELLRDLLGTRKVAELDQGLEMEQIESEATSNVFNIHALRVNMSPLERDLEQQSTRCSQLERDLEQQSAHSSQLERDLEQQSARCSQLERDLERQSAHCFQLDMDLEQQSTHSSRLKRDLEQQSTLCSQQERDLEQQSAFSSQLEMDLEQQSTRSSRLKRDLEQQSTCCSQLERDLEQQSAHFSLLEKDLEQQSTRCSQLERDLERQSAHCFQLEMDLEQQSTHSSRLKRDLEQQSAFSSQLERDLEQQNKCSSQLKRNLEPHTSGSSQPKKDLQLQCACSFQSERGLELQHTCFLQAAMDLELQSAHSSQPERNLDVQSACASQTEMETDMKMEMEMELEQQSTSFSQFERDLEHPSTLPLQLEEDLQDSKICLQETEIEQHQHHFSELQEASSSQRLHKKHKSSLCGCEFLQDGVSTLHVDVPSKKYWIWTPEDLENHQQLVTKMQNDTSKLLEVLVVLRMGQLPMEELRLQPLPSHHFIQNKETTEMQHIVEQLHDLLMKKDHLLLEFSKMLVKKEKDIAKLQDELSQANYTTTSFCSDLIECEIECQADNEELLSFNEKEQQPPADFCLFNSEVEGLEEQASWNGHLEFNSHWQKKEQELIAHLNDIHEQDKDELICQHRNEIEELNALLKKEMDRVYELVLDNQATEQQIKVLSDTNYDVKLSEANQQVDLMSHELLTEQHSLTLDSYLKLLAQQAEELENYSIKLEIMEKEKNSVLDLMAEKHEAELEQLRTALLFGQEEAKMMKVEIEKSKIDSGFCQFGLEKKIDKILGSEEEMHQLQQQTNSNAQENCRTTNIVEEDGFVSLSRQLHGTQGIPATVDAKQKVKDRQKSSICEDSFQEQCVELIPVDVEIGRLNEQMNLLVLKRQEFETRLAMLQKELQCILCTFQYRDTTDVGEVGDGECKSLFVESSGACQVKNAIREQLGDLWRKNKMISHLLLSEIDDQTDVIIGGELSEKSLSLSLLENASEGSATFLRQQSGLGLSTTGKTEQTIVAHKIDISSIRTEKERMLLAFPCEHVQNGELKVQDLPENEQDMKDETSRPNRLGMREQDVFVPATAFKSEQASAIVSKVLQHKTRSRRRCKTVSAAQTQTSQATGTSVEGSGDGGPEDFRDDSSNGSSHISPVGSPVDFLDHALDSTTFEQMNVSISCEGESVEELVQQIQENQVALKKKSSMVEQLENQLKTLQEELKNKTIELEEFQKYKFCNNENSSDSYFLLQEQNQQLQEQEGMRKKPIEGELRLHDSSATEYLDILPAQSSSKNTLPNSSEKQSSMVGLGDPLDGNCIVSGKDGSSKGNHSHSSNDWECNLLNNSTGNHRTCDHVQQDFAIEVTDGRKWQEVFDKAYDQLSRLQNEACQKSNVPGEQDVCNALRTHLATLHGIATSKEADLSSSLQKLQQLEMKIGSTSPLNNENLQKCSASFCGYAEVADVENPHFLGQTDRELKQLQGTLQDASCTGMTSNDDNSESIFSKMPMNKGEPGMTILEGSGRHLNDLLIQKNNEIESLQNIIKELKLTANSPTVDGYRSSKDAHEMHSADESYTSTTNIDVMQQMLAEKDSKIKGFESHANKSQIDTILGNELFCQKCGSSENLKSSYEDLTNRLESAERYCSELAVIVEEKETEIKCLCRKNESEERRKHDSVMLSSGSGKEADSKVPQIDTEEFEKLRQEHECLKVDNSNMKWQLSKKDDEMEEMEFRIQELMAISQQDETRESFSQPSEDHENDCGNIQQRSKNIISSSSPSSQQVHSLGEMQGRDCINVAKESHSAASDKKLAAWHLALQNVCQRLQLLSGFTREFLDQEAMLELDLHLSKERMVQHSHLEGLNFELNCIQRYLDKSEVPSGLMSCLLDRLSVLSTLVLNLVHEKGQLQKALLARKEARSQMLAWRRCFMRAEARRRALVFQKDYLLLELMDAMGCDNPLRGLIDSPRPQRQLRNWRFRLAVHVVRATIRLNWLHKKRRKRSREALKPTDGACETQMASEMCGPECPCCCHKARHVNIPYSREWAAEPGCPCAWCRGRHSDPNSLLSDYISKLEAIHVRLELHNPDSPTKILVNAKS
uniref:Pericentrin/AKAP-450 centrosomal targeting domain-containing protein n=2 Tax=Eptatretus burgeri TaxID=7764 RepID=A0A8C4QQP5_EPTBU